MADGTGQFAYPVTGNELFNPNPESYPGGPRNVRSTLEFASPAGAVPGARSVLFPGDVHPDKTSLILDASRFVDMQSLSAILLSGANVLLLDSPPNKRLFLEIRNSVNSIGSLAVGLNEIPASIDTPNWLIAPGDSIVREYTIPQNRLFAVAFGGDLRYTLTFANLTIDQATIAGGF